MSFMFKPYPFVDPVAVNHIQLPPVLRSAPVAGNGAVAARLLAKQPRIILLDGYVGADFSSLIRNICELLPRKRIELLKISDAYRSSDELENFLTDFLPEDRVSDPILLFGKSHPVTIESLIDQQKLKSLSQKLKALREEADLVILYGQGAVQSPLAELADLSAFLDVTPMNAVLRVNARRCGALGDSKERTLRYLWRRLYYFDYEIMMLHRKDLIDNNRIDYYIDSNLDENLKLIGLNELKELFEIQLKSPFRCTPVYLEGVWGGFFVKQLRHLPEDMRNCAWVFDMIPNEVSLQIKVGPTTFNFAFSTFFKTVGQKLMGEESVKRFGYIFPIRFNYDDTYGGSGNMSIQVHPPQAYNQEHFGEPFQQDESYYCVKTAGSRTYQGLQDDCDVNEFFQCIDKAEKEHIPFDHDKYVNSFPSEQGDQFLLPGGTIHASGRNQVILEIGSYTIGSYTFKLYDYLRMDLDGKPRPIHSNHGKNVLVTDRRRSKIDGWLRPKPRTVREGDGWKEEIVGECDLIYFSLRRLSFEHSVSDCTDGKFHVLTLVEGDEVLVYSKVDPTCCFHQKFMDIVVIPASMGEYGIINLGTNPCKVHKTLLK
ncbi:MAG: class I mannose-6-phosphate isomerase [Victivallales bacterium]|nr:class I mannose-6-phosphate isomerase [Victivallales bacterium]